MMSEKKYQGKLSISKYLNHDIVHLTVTDSSSRITFLDLEIGVQEFAAALFSQPDQPCEFDLRGLHLIGKVREHKREVVLIPVINSYGAMERQANVIDALKPHQVDGWTGSQSDATNHHRMVRAQCTDTHDAYDVGFVRYIDAQ